MFPIPPLNVDQTTDAASYFFTGWTPEHTACLVGLLILLLLVGWKAWREHRKDR